MKLPVRVLVVVLGSSLIVASLAIVDMLSPPEMVLESRPPAKRLLIRANLSQSDQQASVLHEETARADAELPPLMAPRSSSELPQPALRIDGVEAYLRSLRLPSRPRVPSEHYRTTLGQRLKWDRE